jgi:aminodeoxyfutalosine synthase
MPGDKPAGWSAEVFSPAARATIADRKLTGDEWLAVHRRHALGIPSNCTMLYGHVETLADRADHLLARALRTRRRAFSRTSPRLPPGPQRLNHPGTHRHRDLRDRRLKNIAVGRLVLDNIPHVKTHWPMVTPFCRRSH